MTRTRKIVIAVVGGVLVCLVVIAGILVGAATVGWRAAVRSGNAVAAIKALETIDAAERQYHATQGQKYGTFQDLVREQLVDSRFNTEAPVVDGYVYKLTISHNGYVVTANPLNSSTGRNHFYRDSTSDVIRVNSDRIAGPGDPPVIYKP
ncbi:MAG TPA: hypothetical protein VJT71_18635 [Pyrinomonadaceae bacterium]|nr:hypothetical protein [Pyrinomonadaceae bacterium]